jgi:hypothetical protein
MFASRNVFFAAVAASVLAGCQTAPRECDNRKPNNVIYNGKCCSIGQAPCRELRGGAPEHRGDQQQPAARPQ